MEKTPYTLSRLTPALWRHSVRPLRALAPTDLFVHSQLWRERENEGWTNVLAM